MTTKPTQLNACDLALFLGVHWTTITRWRRRGYIHPVCVTRQTMYNLADVRRAVAKHNLAVVAADSDWPEEPTV